MIIVIGSMVSLVYYLRVVAAVWMQPDPAAVPIDAMPAIAGGFTGGGLDAAPDCAPGPGWWLVVVFGLACATATVVFGIAPSPLIDWASHAAGSQITVLQGHGHAWRLPSCPSLSLPASQSGILAGRPVSPW